MKNELKNAILPIENAVVYLNKFDEQEACASLDWAIECMHARVKEMVFKQ